MRVKINSNVPASYQHAVVGTSYTPLAVFRGRCTPDTESSTVCAPQCRRILRPIVRHKTLSQIVPRVGIEANYFRWGQPEYLEHRQYFEILCTARKIIEKSVSILRVHKILACVLSGFGTHHIIIKVTLSMWAFSHCSQWFGRQYSNTHTARTRTMICSRAFFCETFMLPCCCCLHIKPSFLPSFINTPSVRPDSLS